VTIRPATPSDATALSQLARRAIRATPYDSTQIHEWGASFTPETLAPALTAPAFVYEADGEPLGFATLIRRDDGSAELDLLYVDPECSRIGIGRALVDTVAAEAANLGAPTLWADASRPAQLMLARCGFEAVAPNPKELRGTHFDNVWMALRLSSSQTPDPVHPPAPLDAN
jgi:GNAT superfamily N-acetyltransferase